MKTTCGIFLIYNDELLICHTTHGNSKNWSIPKGLAEDSEDHCVAAEREFKEETGINITEICSFVFDIGTSLYKNNKKELHGYIGSCSYKPTEFHCSSLVDGKFPEVDQIKFVKISEALEMIHYTQAELLNRFLSGEKDEKE